MPPNRPISLCEQCKATGLPILPVRYAVVPKNINPALPAWASGDRVKNVGLGSDFQYALRTLRTGYLYLFYAKNARGSKQWECYAVGEDGSLIRQADTKSAQPQSTPKLSCSRHGSANTQVHYLVIERPESCGATWIAYSEHKWSQETIKEYETNSKLRDKRMQTIQPPVMAAGTKHSHGQIVDKATLETVLEYAPSTPEAPLPFNPNVVGALSKEDGSYDAAKLEQMSTRYPWHLRTDMAEGMAKHMENRGKGTGQANKPHVLALWDAIGIAHELNGFRNDAAGWIKKYGDERELQITAIHAIEGAKKALQNRAQARGEEYIRRGIEDGPLQEGQRELEEKVKNSPDDEYLRSQLEQMRALNQLMMATKDQTSKEFGKSARTQAWPKYEEKLNRPAINNFNKKWNGLLAKADTIIDRRTEALIKWLEAPLLIDTLEDFHRTSVSDGMLFEDAIGDAIFGIGSSKAGQKKIDEWVKEAKASVQTNLVWRAIALNQQEGVAEVDAALREVYGGAKPLTSSAWDNAVGQVKWNKLADLTKKSLTFFNTQMKAVNDPASGIAPVKTTRGMEKIFATIGGSWLKPFAWTVDTVNEAMLRTLMLVRSGVDPIPAKALVTWEISHNVAGRDDLIRRLKNNNYYLSQAAIAEYEAHAKKWADLKKAAEIPDAKRQSFNAARDARLALVVAVFEAFNLYKASSKAAKQPGNEQVQAQLTAAKCATTAAALDVLSNFVKGLAAAGDKAVSYQLLKGAGGGLSVVASGYGAALDWGDAGKLKDHGDYRLASMYFVRGTFQAISATLTALTAFSYCSPLIETFGTRFGQRLVGRAALAAAQRLLFMRAALMLASIEVAIFVLAVTLVIWYFEDDAFQKWCHRCAFGLERMKYSDRYTNADKQLKAFNEALAEVR